jgi:hypothetical protein
MHKSVLKTNRLAAEVINAHFYVYRGNASVVIYACKTAIFSAKALNLPYKLFF